MHGWLNLSYLLLICRTYWSSWESRRFLHWQVGFRLIHFSTPKISVCMCFVKLVYVFCELGSIYTMAEGHDHKIVRALETHPKAILWNIVLHFVWSQAFMCSLKDIRDRALDQMLFHYHPIDVGTSIQSVILNQGLWDFEVSWSPGLC